MKSRWYEYKEDAVAMRKSGMSMTVIERKLGIPRSTLSGWFRNVQLTDKQRSRLSNNSRDGWKKARERAVESHRAKKALRLLEAERSASNVIERLTLDSATLDLAFAMLYMGEGAKGGTTSIANSDPVILQFVLAVLQHNYGIKPESIKCDLHIRADQDPDQLKKYWSEKLGIPLENFRKSYIDQRSAGRPTYDRYKGVCVLYCGTVAIQRKLVYLYTLFCKKVAQLQMGG